MSATIETTEKKVKKKGPIRFEAIIPVVVLSLLTFLYFSIYFDRHLKSLIEYVGTQGNGAEVNVESLNTSFIRGDFEMKRIEVTDKEKPKLNALEIGNIHFKFLWDALLRMKFVVEDASITNIQIQKPRRSEGKVLPPEPAKPSKINELQDKVMAQVKNKYGANVLGDALALLEGGDYKDQINTIRGTLKSEARVQSMITDVKGKREQWDGKVKSLSDTSNLKVIEAEIQALTKEKDFLKQAAGAKKLNDRLKEVDQRYKDIQAASKQLKSEVDAVAQYPKELQALVNEDVASLKNRFQIPQVDFKDMAMHLFAGEFAQYIAKARKYQAMAKQYVPEKKEDREEVIPPPRSAGKTFLFPVTTGYPLFWLKRAAISSKGTADSYAGDVSGELTNVTTDPKHIKKPVMLDMQGNFPAVKVMGVKALITLDHTRDIAKQSALVQVNSFPVPERMFVNDKNLKFGFLNANGSTTFSANMAEGNIDMNWTSALSKPQFLVETQNKIAREMLNNILTAIPVININGTASGSFDHLKMHINSNLGSELAQGFTREIGAKVAEAQAKLNSLVEDKIKGPQKELMDQLGANGKNLTDLNNLQELYNKNKDRIQAEITKLKSGGGGTKQVDELKDKGKKLLKGIKW
ncbi:MAG TPA: TIGR03545 family protein [Bacteriovoracaceae bacterium]|nr:TIGR03545 family protein [Bacteriovoracaceae bacterium]